VLDAGGLSAQASRLQVGRAKRATGDWTATRVAESSCGCVGMGEAVRPHPVGARERWWPVEPVAKAHIDCDWHDSVMVCLERVGPCWSRRGTFVIDCETRSGARMAAHSFLSRRRDE
jgi:hypothetical protein